MIDIGGTLLERDAPGAYHRAADGIRHALGRPLRPDERRAVADCVLCGAGRDGAVRALAEAFALARSDAKALSDRLRRPEGRARLLPGAKQVLQAARTARWRIVAATNVASWVPALPDSLAADVHAVLSSCDVGVVKHSPDFWKALLSRYGVDPATCLVVGDDLEADVAAPRRAGLLALAVGSGARRTALADLAALLAALGPPPSRLLGVVAGLPLQWAGQAVLEVPNLAPLVESVTRRRIELVAAGRSERRVVVRRRGRAPAVSVGDPARAVLLYAAAPAREERRLARPPSDLLRRLESESLTLDQLASHNQRHLVSMVREASDPATRAARIQQVVEFLQASQPRS